MKKSTILKKLREQLSTIKAIGFRNFVLHHLASDGERVRIKLRRHCVLVRKGTPDLRVVISCLVKGEFSELSKFLDGSFSGIIIDAGAYIGASALALSDMFPSARIICIEPSTENLEMLKANIFGKQNISFLHGALVGKSSGSIQLKDRGTGAWGFTTVSEPLDNANAECLHSTPALTLSTLGVDISLIGLLKLDIEGAERELLLHDASNVNRIKVIVAELHDRIVSGCSDAFEQFSKERIVLRSRGEKYFSIKLSGG